MFENIEEESCRCRRREHFYDSKRNEFAGKTDPSGKVFKQTGNEIKEPGSAEYSDGRHKSISVGMIRTTVKKPLFAPLINVS